MIDKAFYENQIAIAKAKLQEETNKYEDSVIAFKEAALKDFNEKFDFKNKPLEVYYSGYSVDLKFSLGMKLDRNDELHEAFEKISFSISMNYTNDDEPTSVRRISFSWYSTCADVMTEKHHIKYLTILGEVANAFEDGSNKLYNWIVDTNNAYHALRTKSMDDAINLVTLLQKQLADFEKAEAFASAERATRPGVVFELKNKKGRRSGCSLHNNLSYSDYIVVKKITEKSVTVSEVVRRDDGSFHTYDSYYRINKDQFYTAVSQEIVSAVGVTNVIA